VQRHADAGGTRCAAGAAVDLVVACDCVYPDPDGPSPDAEHFVAALAALCAPRPVGAACREAGRQPAAGVDGGAAAAAPGVEGRECAGAAPGTTDLEAGRQGAHARMHPGSQGEDSGSACKRTPQVQSAAEGSSSAGDDGALRCPPPAGACAGGPAAASGRAARALVTFEARSDAMREAFLGAARRRFAHVRRVPAGDVPLDYRAEHVELYDLSL